MHRFALLCLLLGCTDDGAGGAPAADVTAGPTHDGPLPDLPAGDAAPADDDAAVPEPDAAMAPPDAAIPDVAVAPSPPEVHAVETEVGAPTTPAGVANRVTCRATDAAGGPIDDVATLVEVRPAAGFREGDEPGELVGVEVGTYYVTCTAPGLGLRDTTPARWDVRPGPAAVVRARVDPGVVVAGGATEVSCAATDREGNPVPAEAAEVSVRPANAGVLVEGRRATLTTAGIYQADCTLAGAITDGEARITVVAASPAQLVGSVEPDLGVHEVGSVVSFVARVTDRFDNPVAGAALEWSTAPALAAFGEGRFRADAEGRYALRVRATGETFEGRVLEDTAEILVDAGGPSIACIDPPPGAMLGRPAALVLRGRVDDVAGIESLTVDDAEAELDAEGHFTAQVAPGWGLNVHEIVATDAVGNVNSTFCSYFASERYVGEDAPIDDAILLHLSQAALDDGPPDRPLNSLIDLLRRVVDSPGLVRTIDQTLRAQNPILPERCEQRVPILGCVLSVGAEYRGIRIRGPNTLSARLVEGGLRMTVRISRLDLDVQMRGTVSNSGTLHAAYVEIELTFDVDLADGRPRVALRETNRVEVGDLDSDFDGAISGALLDLVFEAFEGTVRNELVGALRGFLEQEIDALLSDVLAGLDLDALGLALEVPAIAGGEAAVLSLGVGFSSLDASPARLRLGISSRVNGPSRQGAASAGVALPPGPVRVELHPQGSTGAAVHLGLVNQLLHRLWRAGLFDLGGAADLLGDLPAGAEVSLRVQAPPAVIGTGEGATLQMHLGPITGVLSYPGFFDEPLRLRLAAYLRVPVLNDGGRGLVFGGEDGIEIERIFVAVEGVPMAPEARATLERDLGRILQAVVDQALNGALPALPIPDFALPGSLVPFGVAPGTRLGLRGASLGGTATHFLLDGTFRE